MTKYFLTNIPLLQFLLEILTENGIDEWIVASIASRDPMTCEEKRFDQMRQSEKAMVKLCQVQISFHQNELLPSEVMPKDSNH